MRPISYGETCDKVHRVQPRVRHKSLADRLEELVQRPGAERIRAAYPRDSAAERDGIRSERELDPADKEQEERDDLQEEQGRRLRHHVGGTGCQPVLGDAHIAQDEASN